MFSPASAASHALLRVVSLQSHTGAAVGEHVTGIAPQTPAPPHPKSGFLQKDPSSGQSLFDEHAGPPSEGFSPASGAKKLGTSNDELSGGSVPRSTVWMHAAWEATKAPQVLQKPMKLPAPMLATRSRSVARPRA